MNIIPDVDIARAALNYWRPTYQAEIMTAIALVENGGDADAIYLNTTGIFAGYADRGLWAINEAAIREVRADRCIDPALFRDVDESAHMAWDIWSWRLEYATTNLHYGYSAGLVYAYEGWTTYKRRFAYELVPVWATMRRRAKAAVAIVAP